LTRFVELRDGLPNSQIEFFLIGSVRSACHCQSHLLSAEKFTVSS
jgi:hypothetical protein